MRGLIVFLVAMVLNLQAADPRVDIGLFSQQDVSGWRQRSFAGQTQYSLQPLDGRVVLFAESEAAASAWYKKIKVDLTQTPVLNWSWRKHRGINPGDESKKSGDDFVARLYVIKDGGLFFWKTQALNYVWSFQHEKGEEWVNPFAVKNAWMVAQQDASSASGEWFVERRNIVSDFARLYGRQIDSIDGVALMTDSDNSGSSASAYYGDIYFSAR